MTHTTAINATNLPGKMKQVFSTLTVSAYTVGGEVVTPAEFKLKRLIDIRCSARMSGTDAPMVVWNGDTSAPKIMALGDVAGANGLSEVGAIAITIDVVATGI